jgi:hypothetical protein
MSVRVNRAGWAAALLCGMAAGGAWAQGQATAKADAGASAPMNAPVAVSERHTFERLGVSIALPEDATAIEDAVGNSTVGRVREIKDRWVMSIERKKSTNTNLKLSDVADAALKQLMDAFGQTIAKDGDLMTQPTWKLNPDTEVVQGKRVSVATLLLREPSEGRTLTVRNNGKALPAERVYVFMPAMDSRRAAVRGVTFVQVGPGEFLTFDMVTDATQPSAREGDAASVATPSLVTLDMDSITSARAPYEMMVTSAELASDAANETQRAATIKATQAVLSALTTEQLREIVEATPERWERVYRPSPTGKSSEDEEVGYRRILVAYDQRRKMPGITVRGVEGATPGFIVRIDARVLDGERIIDSSSAFFMMPDRSEESWSVRMTIRTGETSVTHTEVGARVGQDMKVTITSDDGSNERVIRPQVAPEGYISRVESYLMPAILVRASMPTIYGSYAYQSQSERVQYRRDILEQPRGGSKAFTLRTRLSDDQPTDQVTLLDEKGNLVRGELSTGVLSEPSTGQEIRKLWQAKGLPLK